LTPLRITLFEVPAAADAPFLAAWDGAHRPAEAAGPVTLLRALRDDVALRFVALGPAAWLLPALPAAGRGGRYDPVGEHGTPDGDGGVLEVAAYPAAPGLVAAWDAVQRTLGTHRGHLGARLYSAVEGEPAAALALVTLTRWSSPLMVARARREPAVRDAEQTLPAPAAGALYLPVR